MPTFTSNTAVSQAVFIQEQLYPGSAGTSFPSSKQHPRGQKSICPYCFSYHVVALTCLRHHSARKFSINRPHPLENENQDKKNKLDILLFFKLRSKLLQSDCEPRRRVTSARSALTRSSIGFRLESGQKSTSNKTARSENILRGASHQKSWNKEIGYGSITPENRFEQCTLSLIYIISLQGRSPHLPWAARNRSRAFRHLAISCHEKSKALITGIRTMQLSLKTKAATCENSMMMMMIFQRMPEIFVGHCWKQNRWFLRIHYFAMTYSRKLAGKYKTGMRPWSFEISVC